MPLRLTLPKKLALLAAGVAFCSALAVAIITISQLRIAEHKAAEARLAGDARLYAERVNMALLSMERDARMLANMPPISGLMRVAAATDGLDPLDGSTAELWRSRLGRIFVNMLQNQPRYTQARFLVAEGNWQEEVRVNSVNGLTRVVPRAQLQSKGHRDYLSFPDSGPVVRGHYSQITPNVENGVSDGVPTLRYVFPVLDADGSRFGAIVINADFEALLDSARPDILADYKVTAYSDRQDYFTWTADAANLGLQYHEQDGWTPWAHQDVAPAAGTRADGVIQTGASVFYSQPIAAKTPHRPFALSVATETPQALLYAASKRTVTTSVLLASALVALLSFLAYLLGRKIAQPLRRLTDRVRHYSGTNEELAELPVSNDEVGALAQSFRSLANALIRESGRARAIFTSAPDGIVTISQSGEIEDMNPAAEALFGYRSEDVLGEGLALLMPAEDAQRHQLYVDRATVSDTSALMGRGRQVFGRRRDGSFCPIEVSISRSEYSGSSHFIGVVRDISERRKGEEKMRDLLAELEHSNAELARSNAELDTFAYVASHDLKAPLRVIDNASRWLEEDLEAYLDDDTRESMELLRNRVFRMEKLLDDLLEFSRIGRSGHAEDVVSAEQMVKEVRELINLPPDMRFEVSGDLQQIRLVRMPLLTVLLNLVSNAIKHHDRAAGRVSLDIAQHGTEAVLTVSDDGPGIPEQFHEKIFEIFQTLRPRDEVDGSGIGLSIVRKHVDVMGGRLELDSAEGRGATFRVHWPAAHSSDATAPADDTQPRPSRIA